MGVIRSRVRALASVAMLVAVAAIVIVIAPAEAGKKRPYKNGSYSGIDQAENPVRGPQPVTFKVRRKKVRAFHFHPTMKCGEANYNSIENTDPHWEKIPIVKKRRKGKVKLVTSWLKVIADSEGNETHVDSRLKVKGKLRKRRAMGFFKQTDVYSDGRVCASGKVAWTAKRN